LWEKETTPQMTSIFASNGPQPFTSSTHQRLTFGQHFFLGYYNSAKNLTWGPSLVGSLPSVPDGTRQRLTLCQVSSVTLGKEAVSVTPSP
jgi:hypothetical protein